MRKQLIFIIGLLISLGCLFFAFKGLSLREVGNALQQANPAWILSGLAVYACGFLTRAARWEILIRPIKPISRSQLLRPMVIGFFANNILPFRTGELVRAHVTGQKFGISRTASLGSIILERIFDTISFLSIFLAVALFFPFPPTIRHAAFLLGLTCAALIVSLLVASKHQARTQTLIHRLPVSQAMKEKIISLVLNFTQGVSGITHGSYVLQAVSLSMVIWMIEGTTVYLIARAFPIHITYPQAYFLLFFLGLSVTLPQAPGYIGTVELFGVMALTLLGVAKNMALSVVLTIHACQFVFISALGLWALWKEGLSLSGLLKQEKQPE